MFQLEGLLIDFFHQGRKGKLGLDDVVHVHRFQQVLLIGRVIIIFLIDGLTPGFRGYLASATSPPSTKTVAAVSKVLSDRCL